MNSEHAQKTKDELTNFIERIERLDLERANISEDRKAVLKEAQARGYEAKPINMIVAERKRDAQELSEEQAVVELYKSALMQ